MIQRIQSIWLLIAALLNGAVFKLPFYSGDWVKDNLPNTVINLTAQTTIWNTIAAVLAGLLAIITIFLFTNRKLQLRLARVGMIISLLLAAVCLFQITQFNGGSISPWCILYFAAPLCFLLAANGINKDQKLIKSMDRLR
ncbi:MAG: DUF4293 domain-containing protein [Bacteroidota bacterium]